MRTPRPLNFSRSPISTRPERNRRIQHTPSQSHFGTHPSLIPEKILSLFSNTYGNPFCNPLSFQTHAGMGGWGIARNIQTCKPSNLPTRIILLSPLSATLTTMPISVDSKGLTGKLNPLDATLTKKQGARPSSQDPFPLPDSSPVPRTCILRTIGAHQPLGQTLPGPRFCVLLGFQGLLLTNHELAGFRVCTYKP
jgi:hypothetical protein